MKLKISEMHINMKELAIFLHPKDQLKLGIKVNDRVRVKSGAKEITAFVMNTFDAVDSGLAVLSVGSLSRLGAKQGATVEVSVSPLPKSVRYIRKKMDNEALTPAEITQIMNDIYRGSISPVEISAWLTTLYINGMSLDEVAALAVAIVGTGDHIEFERAPVFDFHSMGGVPGNKITPIVVSICAAAGIMIPKTSSRAISSACGTSDFVEVFCPVEISGARLKEIGETVGGAFAWGGSMYIASVDEAIIEVEYQLGINPRPQMLASILGKKLAIGVDYLLIDIPMGRGTKVPDEESARRYSEDFMALGEKLGIHVECVVTYADQPVGRAVGPALEARECLQVLEGAKEPTSVVEKACECAGIILEMGGIHNGLARAKEILESGEARKKFLEIVEAQGGDPKITSADIPLGKYTHEVRSARNGYVSSVVNQDIVQIARSLGAPHDKGAGILIQKKKGARVTKDEVIYTLYADNEAKLKHTIELIEEHNPVVVGGMVLKRVSG